MPPPRPSRPRRDGRPTAPRSGAVKRSAGKPAPRAQPPAPRKGWGGVARRGAANVGRADGPRREPPTLGPPPAHEPEQWVEEAEPLRRSARGAVQRSADDDGVARRRRKPPPAVAKELQEAVGPAHAARLERQLLDAARAFERERYREAARMLRPLAEQAPTAAPVRELYGLTLYRLDRYRDAAPHLEAARAQSGSWDQVPVLADCHRALRHWKTVETLWDELREASPSADVVAEGRIVAAGARADRGDIAGAIRLLEGRARERPKRPRWHHLRLWYALADLYERAGDVPRARELFSRITSLEPDFADAAERLGGLG